VIVGTIMIGFLALMALLYIAFALISTIWDRADEVDEEADK